MTWASPSGRCAALPASSASVLPGLQAVHQEGLISEAHESCTLQAEPFLGAAVMCLLVVGVYPSRTQLLYPGQASWAKIFAGVQRLVGRVACITLAGAILLEVETGKVLLCLPALQSWPGWQLSERLQRPMHLASGC